MKKQLLGWGTAEFLVISALGPLLHMTYEWSGQQRWTAFFSAVNESTWEHMKLLFVPVFLLTLLEVLTVGREWQNFLAVRTASLLAGLLTIPVLFYTYTGILGKSVMWVDIAIFFIAALVTVWLHGRWLSEGRLSVRWQQTAGLLLLFLLAFAFLSWTFEPPQLGLWQDPTTGGYGLPQP